MIGLRANIQELGYPWMRRVPASYLRDHVKEWNEVFPNATCIVTLLDWLLHHADVTAIEGDSYRIRESEQETAKRRKK